MFKCNDLAKLSFIIQKLLMDLKYYNTSVNFYRKIKS